MTEMIAVLAGTRGQFRIWCRENQIDPDHGARHILGERDLVGARFSRYVRVGTWASLPSDVIASFIARERLALAMGELPR